MNDDPLMVLSTVPADVVPVLDALARLHRDVGSVQARKVLFGETPEPPDFVRLICVGCVDEDDVTKLSRDLTHELRDDPDSAALASRVKIIRFQDGLRVVVFRELVCVSVIDQPMEDRHD